MNRRFIPWAGKWALAGGHTEEADLKKVRIITKDGYYGQTLQFNLKKYSETGVLPRYIMRREDTFIVPHKRSFLGLNVGAVATFVGGVTSAILICDRLSEDEEDELDEVTEVP